MTGNRLLQVKMRKQIEAQSAELYPVAVQTGQEAQKAFGNNEGNNQMRGLEQVAYSARKVTDVYDFIKNQTGKSREGERWRAQGPEKTIFGARLLKHLEGLEEESKRILKVLEIDSEQDLTLRRYIHLELIRTFVRSMTSQYLYARSAQ